MTKSFHLIYHPVVKLCLGNNSGYSQSAVQSCVTVLANTGWNNQNETKVAITILKQYKDCCAYWLGFFVIQMRWGIYGNIYEAPECHRIVFNFIGRLFVYNRNKC